MSLTKDDVKEAVTEVMESFGFDSNNKAKMRSNLEFLDRFKRSSDQVTSAGRKALATVLVTGVAGMLWLGFKETIVSWFHIR